MHRTRFQVYHGLAGLIIVEDDVADSLGLPQDYGVDDIPMVLQDRRFDKDGKLEYLTSMSDGMGMRGNTMLVNGRVDPYIIAKTDTLRFRFLNGSNSREYSLLFNDGRRFHQISSDGGMLEKPFETDKLTLGPAERAEIIVDISDGRTVYLQSLAVPRGGMMSRRNSSILGGQGRFNVLEIRPDEGRKRAILLPKRLLTLDTPDPQASIRTRVFTLGMGSGMGMGMRGDRSKMMGINGQSMDINIINETVKLNTQEIWVVENPTMLRHPFHIHDVQFRIIEKNGKPPHPGEAGLKDTVVIPPRERVRLLLSFSDFADPDAPYMYHCHNLEHEDTGMMGQFTVVS